MRAPCLVGVHFGTLLVCLVTVAPVTAQKAWTDCIGKGLGGWREPGAWVNVGGASPDASSPRRLTLSEGHGVLCNGKHRTRNLLTEREFGDIEAHIEFLVPKGSNSGVYFQGRYEIQILDSFGKSKPGFGDCGGIYQRWRDGKVKGQSQGFEGHAPSRNASRAPGEWQSFDVVFRAPRFDAKGKKTANARFVRVEHNGVLVHENVELTGPTRAASFRDERAKGPLMFQGDHGPVAFRNVRVRSIEHGTKSKRNKKNKKARRWLPTSEHKTVVIEGFSILVDPRLIADKPLHESTMRELTSQLYQITRKVPKPALAKLRNVKIYVERRSKTKCMAYHPSRRWLVGHDFNPEMAKCVELANPKAFLGWTKAQPWMVLHELAHAYHHQFLDRGFGNVKLKECFAAAKASKSYDSIMHINGQKVRAYALTNPMEFFAEASEAFFGTNDMFPFVRSELKAHDPLAFELLVELWGR